MPIPQSELNSLMAQASKNGVQLEANVMFDRYVYVSLLKTDKPVRNQGRATKAMNDLIEFADRHHCPIALTPEPLRGEHMGKSRLVRFYTRMGFVKNGTGRYYRPDITGSYVRPAR